MFSLFDFGFSNGVALGVKPKLKVIPEILAGGPGEGTYSSCVYESLVSFAETPNRNRDRSAYIAQYHRTQKSHKVDIQPMIGEFFLKQVNHAVA